MERGRGAGGGAGGNSGEGNDDAEVEEEARPDTGPTLPKEQPSDSDSASDSPETVTTVPPVEGPEAGEAEITLGSGRYVNHAETTEGDERAPEDTGTTLADVAEDAEPGDSHTT